MLLDHTCCFRTMSILLQVEIRADAWQIQAPAALSSRVGPGPVSKVSTHVVSLVNSAYPQGRHHCCRVQLLRAAFSLCGQDSPCCRCGDSSTTTASNRCRQATSTPEAQPTSAGHLFVSLSVHPKVLAGTHHRCHWSRCWLWHCCPHLCHLPLF